MEPVFSITSQPVEAAIVRRWKDDLILQVCEIENRNIGHVRPIGGQIEVLLQCEVCGRNDP
jgi:hypothetical protein